MIGRIPRSGELIHRIAIEQPSEGRTSSGAMSVTWATVDKRWAQKLDSTSREVQRSRVTNPETEVMFIIRGRLALTAKMRIVCQGRSYDILGITTDDGSIPEKADWIAVTGRAGVSRGN